MPNLRESLTYQPAELAFGTSGLRGLVADMTDLECYINAVGFLEYLLDIGHVRLGGKVAVAGDLRSSTPRILQSVTKAIRDIGAEPLFYGLIPTPTLAFQALQDEMACIMVTGSHIPDDRNGIKFYKADGEVLKSDEAAIKASVAQVRERLYAGGAVMFTPDGMLVEAEPLPQESSLASDQFIARYTSVFAPDTLAGKHVIVYQHSAVGRDMLVTLMEALGATVTPVGRSEKFIPIDTENVTPDDQRYFHQLATQYPDTFGIISTDGDSDRPFVIDQHGEFHRGDVLGAVVADWLQADFAAFPVSSSDAVTSHLTDEGVAWEYTRIGSPYVISAMQAASQAGKQRVVGWEVNGGFLLGVPVTVGAGTLAALPTRDAILPIIVALAAAAAKQVPVSAIFDNLPQRATQAGLINDFPSEVSQKIISRFAENTPQVRAELEAHFSKEKGFGAISDINSLDGVRIFFDNGDIAHLRPSGNAPQLRIYSVADTQERADEIVRLALAEPDGIFRSIENALQ